MSLFRSMIAGVAAAALTLPALAEDSFPDAWFFSGKDRPAKLRELEGKPAPELLTQAWVGDGTSIEGNRGKVVVIDFWATWCGPCVAAIPKNVELVKEYKDKDLVFIGVHDANSGWNEAPKMIKDKGINYPVAHDKGDSAKRYNLQFWPTYVVIDRNGIVRGAGLTPDKVKAAVDILLAEAGAAPSKSAGSGFPSSWYYGGGSRPSAMKNAEGKPAPALAIGKTLGDEIPAAALEGKVRVVHFFAGESPTAKTQLKALAELEKELGTQGVAFISVCHPATDFEATSAGWEKGAGNVRLVQDAKPEKADSATRGRTATAFGARQLPVIGVIDRQGVLRAMGLRAENVRDVVGKLLAEPAPAPKPGG